MNGVWGAFASEFAVSLGVEARFILTALRIVRVALRQLKIKSDFHSAHLRIVHNCTCGNVEGGPYKSGRFGLLQIRPG